MLGGEGADVRVIEDELGFLVRAGGSRGKDDRGQVRI